MTTRHPDVKDAGYRQGVDGCPSPSEVVAELEANAIRVAEIIANSRRLQRENDRLRALLQERGIKC